MIAGTAPERKGTKEPRPIAHGTAITVFAAPASPAADCAVKLLPTADALVQHVRRLLRSATAGTEPPLALFVGAAEAPGAASAASSADEQASEHAEAHPGGVCYVDTSATAEALARAVTRSLASHWFGGDAVSAGLFVEGIAGVALSRAGAGFDLSAADQWVRAELLAGRKVYATHEPQESAEASDAVRTAQGGLNRAAVSFVAYLLATFGPQALAAYLKEFDPNRQDRAANAAFRRPLAVLEEDWQTRLSRMGAGDALRTFLRQIVPLLRPYRWKQVEILVYLLLAAAYNVVQPYAIKIVIDRLTAAVRHGAAGHAVGPIFMHSLGPVLLLLLGIYVLNGVVSLRRAYTVNWLNQNVLNTLQVRMFGHLQRLAHNFYLKSKIGDLMSRLNDDLDVVQSALAQVTNKALYQVFTVVGAITALCMLTRASPAVAIPILCIIPLFAVNYAALRSRNKQASREQRRRAGQAMADVQQHLTAHAVIKAFRLEDKTISDYRSRILALQQSKLRLAILSALTDLSEDVTTALAQLIIFGVGGYIVLRDGGRTLGVGDLSALLVLVKSIFGPIASLGGTGQTLQQATGAMERVSELFDEPVAICDRDGAKPLPQLAHHIRLENVTFRYGGDRDALQGLTLTIPAGANVAIVGPSGSGKSSTVNLLLRFWDPEEGRVLFDGNDIRDVTLASLRDQIGLVFQETFIFDTTLRENIAVGRPGATDAEIAAAAKAAQLNALIESLPDGYDTIPGENGARLSVGQKQRIAIARAFLRDPEILILDEATSALDTKTEAGVLETLRELAKGRTTISVTHRIAQAATADRIFVLENGRLVEEGTHERLVSAGGLYTRLYTEATGFASPPREAVAAAA
ncbi:MAG TPA: ABC transporter ATP-binding protein [Chthonomonadaceae bacterium]|nr:ABC transporter ATP-binding protein [Chthonomonadaceae bacterium]